MTTPASASDTAYDEPDVDDEPDQDPADAELPRAPWSAVRPHFIQAWGYPQGKFNPEHLEILGPNGSGKTYAEATFLQDRVKARNSAVIFIATKTVDETIMQLGWPIVSERKKVRKHRQVIFWPRTRLVGEQRYAYLEAKIYDLLAWLWAQGIKVVVVIDEIATVEGLSARMKKLLAMFWREARSAGITLVAMKQRPQGVQRDMHSETMWIAAFKPKDEEDGFRVAQIMGSHRLWLPRLMALDADRHEFILLHVRTGQAVITWIDIPLKPATPKRRGVYRKAA